MKNKKSSIALLFLIFFNFSVFADQTNPGVLLGNNIAITTNETSYIGDMNKKYPVWWMIDDNNRSTWVFESKINTNPIITINMPKTIMIDEISIINGYSKSLKLYNANNIIKKIVIFDSEKEQEINLKETMEKQKIKLSKIMKGKINIKIKEIKKGLKYNDTCVSELDLLIKGKSIITNKTFIAISGGEYPEYNLFIDDKSFFKYKEIICNAFYIEDGKYAVFENASEIGKNGFTIININNKNLKNYFQNVSNICNTLKYVKGDFIFKASIPKTDKSVEYKEKVSLP